jgi:SAM-dependent methyltransferase
MDVGAGDRVLDVGSGLGTSAVHLARTAGCSVTGVTLEQTGVDSGLGLAHKHGVADRVAFVRGSVVEIDLSESSFDHALLECVLSIIPDKALALDRVVRSLRSGGTVGLTDVTVAGALPAEMQTVLAAVGCLAGAVSLDAYEGLLRQAGLMVERSEDRAVDAVSFVRAVRERLLMANMAVDLLGAGVETAVVEEARSLLDVVDEQLRTGIVSYGLIVASKPS